MITTSSLSSQALQELISIGTRYKYPGGKVLMTSGSLMRRQGVYYILSGSVLIYVMYNSSKNQCVLDYLNKGDFIGEMPLFTKNHYRSATVKTNETCELLLIDSDKMLKLLKNNNEIHSCLTQQLALRLHQTTQRLYTMSFHDVRERLMHYLLLSVRKMQPDTTIDSDIQPIELRITRREIGHTIGCARETAGKLLKELEGQGYLKLIGIKIILLEPYRMILENFDRSIVRIWLD